MACYVLATRTMRWSVAAFILLGLVVLILMVSVDGRKRAGQGDLLPRDLSSYAGGDIKKTYVSSDRNRGTSRNRPSGRRGRKRPKGRHLLTNEEPMAQKRNTQEGDGEQRQEQLLLQNHHHHQQQQQQQQQQLQHLQSEADTSVGVGASSGVKSNFSPAFLRLTPSGNPLKDQPNLSKGRGGPRLRPEEQEVIHGSRRAFTITKLEYLKKEWCKTEPLQQVIREDGCRRRIVMNRFCYGQCNSFFIPKSNKKDIDSAAFRSCAFCKPRRTSTITVTLVCPNRRPRFKRKRIEMVKQCKCMAQRLN